MNSTKLLLILAICTLSVTIAVSLPFVKVTGDYDITVAVDSYVTGGAKGKGDCEKMEVNSKMTIRDLKEKVGKTTMGFHYLDGRSWEDLKCYHGLLHVKNEQKTLEDEGITPMSFIKFKL